MGSKAFLDAIKDVREGESVVELGEALEQIVERVRETGRPGKLTYVLTVKPASKGDTHVLMVNDAITTKLPVLERSTTVFYATPEQGLSRRDPRQPELKGLRDVAPFPQPASEAKEASSK